MPDKAGRAPERIVYLRSKCVVSFHFVVKWSIVIELVVIYTDDQHFRIGPASDQNTVHCEIVFRKSVKHSSIEKPLVGSAIKLLRQQTHAAARSKHEAGYRPAQSEPFEQAEFIGATRHPDVREPVTSKLPVGINHRNEGNVYDRQAQQPRQKAA
jgi:hypothetical protein